MSCVELLELKSDLIEIYFHLWFYHTHVKKNMKSQNKTRGNNPIRIKKCIRELDNIINKVREIEA